MRNPETEMDPEMRDKVQIVKARIAEATTVFERIAAYNSEGVIAGLFALLEEDDER